MGHGGQHVAQHGARFGIKADVWVVENDGLGAGQQRLGQLELPQFAA